jgi:hypothetical protein
VDVLNNSQTDGTQAQLRDRSGDCHGGSDQQWAVDVNGTITSTRSGLRAWTRMTPEPPTAPDWSCGPTTVGPTSGGLPDESGGSEARSRRADLAGLAPPTMTPRCVTESPECGQVRVAVRRLAMPSHRPLGEK